MTEKPDILRTEDRFVVCVKQIDRRAIAVYRRQHGGKEYIRFRVWHKHRTLGVWYPDKFRRFIVPLRDATALAQAILQAAEGRLGKMPAWLAERDGQGQGVPGRGCDAPFHL